MTDQELVQLIQTQLPSELPPELLRTLRERIKVNSQLRQAVLIELQLEQGLATAYAPDPKRWEEILARHETADRVGWVSRWALVAVLAALGLILCVSLLVIVQQVRRPGSGKGPTIAAAPTTAPNGLAAEDGKAGSAEPGATEPVELDGGVDGAARAYTDFLTAPPPPPTPAEAQWLLFDDPAMRSDASWFSGLGNALRRIRGNAPSGEKNVARLAGTYALLAIPHQTRMLRLGPHNVRKFELDLWRGTDGVRFRLEPDGLWRALVVRRASANADLVAGAAQTDPRFLTHRSQPGIVQQIEFDWGKSPPLRDIGASPFAARFTGALQVPNDGEYEFIATADDGVRLFIDGHKVLEDWSDHPAKATSGKASLRQGSHQLTLEYYNGEGDAVLKLEWAGPGIQRQVIPAAAFTPALVAAPGRGGDERKERREPKNMKAPRSHGLAVMYHWGPPLDLAVPQITGARIWSDDQGRLRWLRDGLLDVRYQEGQALLCRGDVVLAAAPLAEQPTSAFLTMEGDLTLLQMTPCLPLAPPQDQAGRVTLDTAQPAELDWLVPPGQAAAVARLPGGALELTAPPGASATVRAMLGVTPAAGSELTLRTSALPPGSALAIETPTAEPTTHVFHLVEHPGGPLLTTNPTDAKDLARRAEEGWAMDGGAWWRVTFGLTEVRLAVSRDGKAWATFWQAPLSDDARLAPSGQVGLLLNNVRPGSRARVEHVTVRRFDAAEQMADAALLAQAPGDLLGLRATGEGLLQKIDALVPAGVAAKAWRMAALAAVVQGSPHAEMRRVADTALLAEVARHGAPADRVVAALDEIWRRRNVGGQLKAPELAAIYDAAARNLLDRGQGDRLPALLGAWLNTHAAQRAWDRLELPLGLTQAEVFDFVNRQRWDALWEDARRALFLARYRAGENPPQDAELLALDLLAWGGANAGQFVPARTDGTAPSWPTRFGHPLVVDADRESSNLLAEFRAAVETRAYDHAGMVLAQRSLPDGIAADTSDAQLFRSNHVVVRETLRRNAELRQLIRQQYSTVANLRLRQALSSGDGAALESLAVQFYGTDAAAAALMQLADRELTLGNFYAAATRYEELLRDHALADPTPAAAKRRLALAMTGEVVGNPVTQAVHLPGASYSAADFERLVREVAGSRPRVLDSGSAAPLGPLAPGPGPLQGVVHSGFRPPPLSATSGDTSWGVGDNRLVINQRTSLTSVDVSTGQQVWSIGFAGRGTGAGRPPLRRGEDDNDPRRVRAANVPERLAGKPAVARNAVYVTALAGRSCEVLRLGASDGARVWRRSLDDDVISDPVVVGPWLYVLTTRYMLANRAEIILRRVNPASGESVMAATIARMRLDRAALSVGQPVLAGDSLIFPCAGALLCVDLMGEVRWIRQIPFYAGEARAASPELIGFPDPVVGGDTVYAVWPGSPCLLAIDARSGSLLWQQLHFRLRSLLGANRTRLFALVGDQIVALDAATGKAAWQRPFAGSPELALAAAGDSLAIVEGAAQGAEPRGLRLTWLAGSDGKVLQSLDLATLRVAEPRAVFTDGQRIFGVARVGAEPRLFVLYR